MGFGKAFQDEKMLEVWNKSDLVIGVPESGLAISCLKGTGLSELSVEIENKLKKIKGQEKRVIEYDLDAHADVIQWLKENTNHSYNVETEYNYEPSPQFPHGSVTISIFLDQVAAGKLRKMLKHDDPNKKISKGMPPKEGW
jgi:hypothetical protein